MSDGKKTNILTENQPPFPERFTEQYKKKYTTICKTLKAYSYCQFNRNHISSISTDLFISFCFIFASGSNFLVLELRLERLQM